MKKLRTRIIILSLLLAFSLSSHAADVVFIWDAVTQRMDGTTVSPTSYTLGIGTTSSNYVSQVSVPAIAGPFQTNVVRNLEHGRTYYVAVKALLSAADQSAWSTELVFTTPFSPIQPPKGLKVDKIVLLTSMSTILTPDNSQASPLISGKYPIVVDLREAARLAQAQEDDRVLDLLRSHENHK